MPIYTRAYKKRNIFILTLCITVTSAAVLYLLLQQRIVKIDEHMTFGIADSEETQEKFFIDQLALDNNSVSAPDVSTSETHRTLLKTTLPLILKTARPVSSMYRFDMNLTVATPASNLALEIPQKDSLQPVQSIPLYTSGMENMTKTVMKSSRDPNTTFFVYTSQQISAPNPTVQLEQWLADQEPVPTSIDRQASPYIQWGTLQSSTNAADFSNSYNLESKVYGYAKFLGYLPTHFTVRLQSERAKNPESWIVIRDQQNRIAASVQIPSYLPENTFEWSADLPRKDFYTFEILNKNAKYGSIFSRISVNTNIFLANDVTIETGDQIQYTSASVRTPIQLNVFDTNQDRIDFSGAAQFSYNLQSDLGYTQNIYAPQAGDYAFTYSKRIRLSNGFFALGQLAPFSPYTIALTNVQPDIIVSRANIVPDGDKITIATPIDSEYFQQALEFKKNTIRLQLTQFDPLYKELFANTLNKYRSLWSGCGVSIFAVPAYPVNAFDDLQCKSPDELPSVLQKIIPEESSVKNLTTIVSDSDLYGAISDDVDPDTTTHKVDLQIQGEHTFLAYAPDHLAVKLRVIELNKTVGADPVLIEMQNISTGELVDSVLVEDDGNASNNKVSSMEKSITLQTGVQPGLYSIAIKDIGQGKNADFLIRSITLNTTALMAVGHVSTYQPMSLYIHSTRLKTVTMQSPSGTTDTVSLNEKNINLSNNDDDFIIPEGDTAIHVGKPRIHLKNADIAFTPEGAFPFGPYHFGADYLLAENTQWDKTQLYSFSIHYEQ